MFLLKLRHFVFVGGVVFNKEQTYFCPEKITNFDETKTSHSTSGRHSFQGKYVIPNKRQFSKQLLTVINKHMALPDTSRWTQGPILEGKCLVWVFSPAVLLNQTTQLRCCFSNDKPA